MDPSKKLRWGICSAGKISQDFVTAMKAIGLPACEDNQAVAVAARSLESAQKFANDHGIAAAYGSYEELAGDPNVDIVYIGCINSEHHRLCLLYLNAGKPILCEKALTTNAALAREIIKVAQEKKLFLMEAYWTRFFPAAKRLREEIHSGKHGPLLHMTCEFGLSITHIERIFKKEMGGGALLDLGCYPIQMACMVFKGKKVKEVVARGNLLSSGVDANAQITVVYEDNAVAYLSCHSKVELQNQCRVYTEKTTFVLPDPMHCPTVLQIVGGETVECPLPESTDFYNFGNSAGLSYEIACVRDCVTKGLTECPQVTHEDSLQVIGIIDEARRQIEKQVLQQ